MSDAVENFEQPTPDHMAGGEAVASSQLIVNLEGFEGPLDLLLSLARDQKVDLTKISVLALAEQYLTYIQESRRLRLEIAADYLVMAAWLAYLKSRLLLPVEEKEGEEPTAAEMALALQFQLQRLEGMRKAAEDLFARPLLGRDVFKRGEPEGIRVVTNPTWEASLFEMLDAYGAIQRRGKVETLTIQQFELFSMDDALGRLRAVLGKMPDWSTLESFLPEDLRTGLPKRSAIAATFAASLELVRDGHVEIRQDSRFGPIYFRSRPDMARDAVTDQQEDSIRDDQS